MTDDPDEIRNGRDLFRATDEQFTYWMADAYGIHKALSEGAYKNLNLEKAKQVRDELTALIEFCAAVDHPFPDLHNVDYECEECGYEVTINGPPIKGRQCYKCTGTMRVVH